MDGGIGNTSEQCKDIIYSGDYGGIIVEFRGNLEVLRERYDPVCIQVINETQAIVYIPISDPNDIPINKFGYGTIPNIYGLLDTSSMEASGVLRLRRQPYLELMGDGIVIGFVDTGIDYTHPVFINDDNTTRIQGIWDQSIQGGPPPAGMLFGTEYTKEQIDQALQSTNPLEIVPSQDTIGHGTFMAGIAAGNVEPEKDFTGAAPKADIVMVKLKQTTNHLRQFYGVQENITAFSENDIMIGITYLRNMASSLRKPLVICLGVGTNMGGHTGTSPLAKYLEEIGRDIGVVVVNAAGNESNRGHHYQSGVLSARQEEEVEITVGEGENGFTLELWGGISNLYSVGLVTPGGEFVSKIPARIGKTEVVRFIFEKTIVYVEYHIIEAAAGDELVVMRFQKPTPGIWRIRVYNESSSAGTFNIWLPIEPLISPNTYFVNSNPYTTVCEPGNARVITISTFNHYNGSIYINSSRGYSRTGLIRPSVAAPGVDIYGPSSGGVYVVKTGSSVAAAHAAGG